MHYPRNVGLYNLVTKAAAINVRMQKWSKTNELVIMYSVILFTPQWLFSIACVHSGIIMVTRSERAKRAHSLYVHVYTVENTWLCCTGLVVCATKGAIMHNIRVHNVLLSCQSKCACVVLIPNTCATLVACSFVHQTAARLPKARTQDRIAYTCKESIHNLDCRVLHFRRHQASKLQVL